MMSPSINVFDPGITVHNIIILVVINPVVIFLKQNGVFIMKSFWNVVGHFLLTSKNVSKS